jgi:hypothetical protein
LYLLALASCARRLVCLPSPRISLRSSLQRRTADAHPARLDMQERPETVGSQHHCAAAIRRQWEAERTLEARSQPLWRLWRAGDWLYPIAIPGAERWLEPTEPILLRFQCGSWSPVALARAILLLQIQRLLDLSRTPSASPSRPNALCWHGTGAKAQ